VSAAVDESRSSCGENEGSSSEIAEEMGEERRGIGEASSKVYRYVEARREIV